MLPDNDRLAFLFSRYIADTASPEEMAELFVYVRKLNDDTLLKNEIIRTYEEAQQEENFDTVEWDDMFARILQMPDPDRKVTISRDHFFKHSRWWAAAAVLAALILGIYLWTQQGSKLKGQVSESKPVNDASPGKIGAILTLADGKKIVLDSLGDGPITKQGNTDLKLKGGQLLYSKSNQPVSGNSNTVAYNTITTPKGREYQLVLPDGTKVWLNAASSLTYPTAFTDSDRIVEMSGEGYFEVMPKNGMRFIVRTIRDAEIEVLGTHFNIMAYEDEDAVKTTLLEGSVKMTNVGNGESVTIRPGQQSRLKQSRLAVIDGVNLDETIAWKDGSFDFESADLKTILRQFSRWYDVNVVYEGPLKNRKFFAIVKRSSSLKTVLAMLQDNDIVYRIEGKNLIVKSD